MIKKFSYIIYKFLKFLDNIFYRIFKKSFLLIFPEFINQDSYKTVKILNNDINFFIPNNTVDWRVNTIFSKEPETMKWIDSFDSNEKFTFWDIGSNIGLYSIYAALIHKKNIEIFSFEPSTSNLRTLSRNISINNLQKNINICPFALGEHENQFLSMNESTFSEGAALNTFGKNYDFEGKEFIAEHKYKIFGTTIDNMITSKILKVPNYIKIDVDGLEHLILKNAKTCLSDVNLKSLLIEINENFYDQFKTILKTMDNFNFRTSAKEQNAEFAGTGKFARTFNYIFERK